MLVCGVHEARVVDGNVKRAAGAERFFEPREGGVGVNEHRVEVAVRRLGGARVVLLLLCAFADADVPQAATDQRAWRRFRARGFEERQQLVRELLTPEREQFDEYDPGPQ